MPQTGTGFVNLSNYLDANQDTLGNEATQLINTDVGAANKAKQQADTDVGAGNVANYQADRGALNNAYTNLQSLGNSGGLQAQIQNQYHEAPGSAGFDAALLGNSGASGALKGAAGGFAGLSGYLDSQLAAQQAAQQPRAGAHQPAISPPLPDEPDAPNTAGKRHYQTEDEPRQPQGMRGGGL